MSLASRRRSWSERISGVATYRRHPNQRARDELPTELQRTTVPTYVRQWVERHAGAGVVRVRRLPGASSTAVHGIYFDDGKRLVLKRYIWSGLLRDEPVAPRRELEALAFAETNALPAPRVVGADVTGDELGDEVPAILMTFLPGVPVAVPDLSALAVVAAEVHATGPDGFGHDYFPWYEATVVRPPPATRRPALWEKAIALRSSAMPSYRPTFIHRDFHPGNVLWSRDRVCGIVDWANACRGPRGCDIAHCRANLLVLAGEDAADKFLAAYERLTGEQYDLYWELASIIEHSPEHWTPARLAQSEPWLARAVEAISGRH